MHLPNQLFHHANETSPASLRTPNWHGSVGSDLDEGTHEFHTEDERAKLGVTLRGAESPQTAAWTPSPPLIYTKLSLLHCAGGIPSFLSQLFSAPLHKSPKGHLNSRAADARVTQRSIVYCSRHAQNINICAQGAACFYYNFFLVRSDCTGRAFFSLSICMYLHMIQTWCWYEMVLMWTSKSSWRLIALPTRGLRTLFTMPVGVCNIAIR